MLPDLIPPLIERMYKLRRPLFLWGPPGVGKSEMTFQATQHLGIELRDYRLSISDPTDVKGFPVPDMKKRVMEWLHDAVLPKTGQGILFLDELSTAPQAVQAAVYQLVLDGRIGSYELPKGWYVMAAGNGMNHKAVVHRMPSPLANRFVHVNVEVSFEAWRKWAFANDVHVDVIAFLALRPDLLNTFNATNNDVAFGTPRSWVFLSNVYANEMTEKVPFPIDARQELFQGTVGEGNAREFVGFLSLKNDIPDLAEIEKKPDTTAVPENKSAQYALASVLAQRVVPKTFDKFMKYIVRLPVEIQVIFVRGAARKDEAVCDTASFQTWSTKNTEFLS